MIQIKPMKVMREKAQKITLETVQVLREHLMEQMTQVLRKHVLTEHLREQIIHILMEQDRLGLEGLIQDVLDLYGQPWLDSKHRR